jgi:hypothetical protein
LQKQAVLCILSIEQLIVHTDRQGDVYTMEWKKLLLAFDKDRDGDDEGDPYGRDDDEE